VPFYYEVEFLFNRLEIAARQKNICFWYLFFLMLSTWKLTPQDAARLSGLHKSQFSRWLKNHSDLPIYNLNQLSKKSKTVQQQFNYAQRYFISMEHNDFD